MTQPNYTDAMMDAVCEALGEWDLTYDQISNLAYDLPLEYAAHMGLKDASEAERKPVAAE